MPARAPRAENESGIATHRRVRQFVRGVILDRAIARARCAVHARELLTANVRG
jgi:hypothetical protein